MGGYRKEYNASAKLVVEEAESFDEGLAAIQVKTKWGFIDKKGKIVVSCEFPYVDYFSEGLVMADVEEYKFCYINTQGKKVFEIEAEEAGSFHEGRAYFYSNTEEQLAGYIDTAGKIVIPAVYQYADEFSEGLAAVENSDRKNGYINTVGDIIIPLKYDDAEPFSKGFALVEDDIALIIIDKEGNEIMGWKRHDTEKCFYSDGIASVKFTTGEWKVYNLFDNTEIALTNDLEIVDFFKEDLAKVKDSHGKFGFIDSKGQLVIPCEYDVADGCKEGLIAVIKKRDKDKWSFIDKRNRIIIPAEYRYAEGFSDELAKVWTKKEIHFINKQNEKVISLTHQRPMWSMKKIILGVLGVIGLILFLEYI